MLYSVNRIASPVHNPAVPAAASTRSIPLATSARSTAGISSTEFNCWLVRDRSSSWRLCRTSASSVALRSVRSEIDHSVNGWPVSEARILRPRARNQRTPSGYVQRVLEVVRRTLLQHDPDAGQESLCGLGRQDLGHRPAQHLRRRPHQERIVTADHVDISPVRVIHHQQVIDRFDDVLQPGAATIADPPRRLCGC